MFIPFFFAAHGNTASGRKLQFQQCTPALDNAGFLPAAGWPSSTKTKIDWGNRQGGKTHPDDAAVPGAQGSASWQA